MKRHLEILLAEDNPNDITLLKFALDRNSIPGVFHFVRDGQEVIAYLRGEGEFANRVMHPFPDLVVLDVKMPQVTGFDALMWLRTHPDCRHLPVVMLSGSGLDKDIIRAYHLGANSYFQKPHSLEALAALLRALVHYWFLAARPAPASGCT